MIRRVCICPLRPSGGGRGRGPRRRRGRVRWVSASALESPTSPQPSPSPGAERGRLSTVAQGLSYREGRLHMGPLDFCAYHRPALELDEVRHGLIVNALANAGGTKSVEFSYWSLGG